MAKRALLVGCNYPGTEAELRGCVNDVFRTKETLITRFGFHEQDIVVMIDTDKSYPQPTGTNIRKALSKIVMNTEPGDILVMHYSGHGVQVPPESGIPDDTGYDECICPTDMNLLTDDDFREIVNNIPHGVQFTFISDSCHSGGLIDHMREQIGSSTPEGGATGVRSLGKSAPPFQSRDFHLPGQDRSEHGDQVQPRGYYGSAEEAYESHSSRGEQRNDHQGKHDHKDGDGGRDDDDRWKEQGRHKNDDSDDDDHGKHDGRRHKDDEDDRRKEHGRHKHDDSDDDDHGKHDGRRHKDDDDDHSKVYSKRHSHEEEGQPQYESPGDKFGGASLHSGQPSYGAPPYGSHPSPYGRQPPYGNYGDRPFYNAAPPAYGNRPSSDEVPQHGGYGSYGEGGFPGQTGYGKREEYGGGPYGSAYGDGKSNQWNMPQGGSHGSQYEGKPGHGAQAGLGETFHSSPTHASSPISYHKSIKNRSLPVSTLVSMLSGMTGQKVEVGGIRTALYNVFGQDASPAVQTFVGILIAQAPSILSQLSGSKPQSSGSGFMGIVSNLALQFIQSQFGNTAGSHDVQAVLSQATPIAQQAAAHGNAQQAYGGWKPSAQHRVDDNTGILISGCQAKETSADANPDDNPKHAYGALSNAIQTVLEEHQGPITVQQMVLKCREVLSKQGFSQRPGLYCSDSNLKAPFICD